VDQGLLPCPDVVVVATGSGGTAAGLAAGLVREGLPTRVRAVAVAHPVALIAGHARALAAATARHLGLPAAAVAGRLEVDGRFVGTGYGHASPLTAAALALAADHGLPLDDTYTAKALACALAEADRGRQVLYWHTLSSAPLEPLLRSAPAEADLPAAVRGLLVG
ncbi:MAG: pyridoxal-phosphate dependent enzyme, partial [Myxococcales bacterium]